MSHWRTTRIGFGIWALFTLLTCTFGRGQAFAKGYGQPEVTAASALVMEWSTGTVLYEKNAHVPRHPASLTKIMTALVALERGYLGEVVTVSEAAAYETGSAMGLVPGACYTLEDLLYGALLPSGNDACVAIAEHVGGSVEKFVRMMNQRALELGALNTQFRNPHGLTQEGHYTTAYDLALIARYAMRLPIFRQIVATAQYEAWRLDKLLPHQVSSTNRLLWSYPGAEGVKTGTTAAAGACLIAAATRDGVRYLSVVMDSLDRWQDTMKLLSWAFEEFSFVPSARGSVDAGTCSVVRGTKTQVPTVVELPWGWPVPRENSGSCPPLHFQVLLAAATPAPIKRGEELGKLVVKTATDVIDVRPVYAGRDVGERRFGSFLLRAACWLLSVMAKAALG
ncbi:MAG: D-alanyl-D-alanine carboxypeptidase family protein [Bacillota bacterium]